MKYGSRSSRRNNTLNRNNHRRQNRLFSQAFEQLEQRRLMSLLGITPGFPQLLTNQTGTVNYTYNATSATGSFNLSSNPFTFQATQGGATHSVLGPSTFTIQFQTDASGNVVGGVVGADFSVTGTIDMNNDFKNDAGDISGTLLTGEISQFGFLNNGTTDQYDFTFTPTSGLLLTDFPASFTNMNIGVTMSSENSTFTGNFTQNFTGKVKAVAGPVPAPVLAPPTGSIAGTKFQDLTGNGFSSDDTPLAGVTIDLYEDANGNGSLDSGDTFIGSQVTDINGNYMFGGLSAGTYFAEETVPAGQTQTGAPSIYDIGLQANQAVSNIDFDNFIDISISGTKFKDATGNSFSADDTGLSGVTINLFQNGATSPTASTITDSNGNYSFPNLGPGSYFVQESVPLGWIETGGAAGYTVNATSGTNVTGDNFDDFQVQSPTLVTLASFGSGNSVVGTAIPQDSAVLAGGIGETGNLTFTLTAPDGTVADTQTITPAGDGIYTTSNTNIATQVGTYTWAVTYAGDTLNNSAHDQGGSAEQVTTTPASPAINTAATVSNGGVVGSAFLADVATLSGGYNPTGTITFSLTAPDGSTTFISAVHATGDNTYNSPTVLATEVGNYTWHAAYSGDANNTGAVDNGANEGVTTIPASPAINTAASVSNGGIVGSAMLADVATLSGGFNPIGSIVFSLTSPDGSTTIMGSDTVNGDGTYNSPSVLATEVGNYTWHATYSGDANNAGASDNGANEGVTTVPASPAINTVGSETNGGVVGSAILSDMATLSGGYNVSGGSITFSLTAPDGTTTTIGSVPVSSTGTYSSAGVLATEVGTYTWHATYSGDGLNLSATDDGTNESVSTIPASPAINTAATISNGGIVGSAMLADVATLSGGFNPTGTISFSLTAPDGTTTPEGFVIANGDNTYNSPSVLATEVGNYTWHATYSGDTNNTGASDNGANEGVTTTKASPTINTVGSETGNGIVGSTTLSDNATISGGYNVSGGMITFTVTNPDGSTSSVGTVDVTGNGTYASPGFTATQVGTYTFHATYSGDGLNLSSTDNGINEAVLVSPASPAINTAATVSNGGIVGSAFLADVATLSGGDNPTGTISFSLTAPDGTTTPEGSVIANGDNTYNSPSVLATEVGNYTWHATYSGDTNNTGASDNGANEGVTTTKASPTINTVGSETGNGIVGSTTLSDNATISGGYNVSGGSITFTLTAPDGTTSTVGTVPVTGNGTYSSPGVTATEVGTYTFHATYSGDTLNLASTDNGTNESVTTIKASPAINTVGSETGTGIVGSTMLSDSATLSGGYNVAGGTITFTLTAPDGTTSSVGTVNVTGDGTYASPSVTATQVGTYTFHAVYSGNGLNLASTDNGVNESVTTIKASPAINTVGSETGTGIVGSTMLSDTATLSGGYNVAGGTITFSLTAPDGTTTTIGSVNVTGTGSYNSASVTATEVGTYTFHAVYSGNGLNLSSTDNGVNESVTTIKASPAIVTSASFKTGTVVGQAIPEDSAVVSGGYLPAGTITFTLKAPNGSVVDTQNVTINGDGTYSTTNTAVATQVGTYTWSVSYAGNATNNGAVDQGGTAEQVVTTKSSPTVVTTASEKAGTSSVVGTAIPEDSAMVSGGDSPTGNLVFTLKGPNGTVADTQTIAITGDGTYATSNSNIATQVGTYTWTVSYVGDTLNSPANDQGGAAEQVVTTKASPTIVTSASKSGTGYCGSTTITDSAVVAGGFNPTGSITFTLVDPSGATISTQNITINGDGTYSPASVATSKVGTYTWHAVYNGDANNITASDQGGTAEQVTIGKATPTVITTASTKSSTGYVVGTAIPEDSAVVSGGDSPTGNLVFTLKAPNGSVADTQTIAITGDGTYATTNTAVATQVGTYTWTVSYNGDTLNNSANDQGGSAEQVVTTKATPTITTTASFKAGCGTMIGSAVPEDSAVVAGGDVPSGSLTFTLTAPNGSVVDTQVVNITGDGTYATTNTVAATQGGTYTWSVTYNGNTLNNSAHDQGGAAEQLVIASGSISGTKYEDQTGNGYSADDTPLSGVTIQLFKSGSTSVLASTVTDANGNYSFTGLATGNYVVKEVVPTGWLQTGPVAGSYSDSITTTSLTSTGNNFTDFQADCDTAEFTNLCFVVQDASGVKTVGDLRGNTNQGDEVTAFFDYTGTSPHPVTFVTYTAPDNTYIAGDASQQQEFQVVTILAQPGENSISVQIPNCDYQIDLVCGYAIDQLGPAGSNIFYSAQSRLISADNDGSEAQASSFGQVNGTVYLDLDNDGKQDSNEAGIGGVTVLLTGKDSHGDAVSLLRVTDSNGDYSFQGLQPGTYSVKEVSPAGFIDGKDTLGTGAGGTMSNDLFSNLTIKANTDGENYNFGELPAKACSGVSGCAATCTFWNGANGQGLICSFGGSSSDCTLGNWLASNYSNLYGSSCGTNCLAGKTNAQICTYFQGLYKNSSSKTACEVLAACLNVYSTDASLGGMCGAAYGFSVQQDGAAYTTYSVGTNGSCFGVSNNTKCSLSDLIAACNSKSSKGSLFGGNSSYSTSCYTVLSGINGW